MKKIALLFDRTYIDAHHCFRELAIQLANEGFIVDLYSIGNSYNYQPFFENQNIRIFPFPVSKMQRFEYWSQILYSKEKKYLAIIATPIRGTWLAYRTARLQKIPFFYLADELAEHLLSGVEEPERSKLAKRNYVCNKRSDATIALGEERYAMQSKLNGIEYSHNHFIIPNAPAGEPVRLRSNYFRDIFNIEDRKPIILFAGTLNWELAKRIYEETKSYSEREYHIVYHARTLGSMGQNLHPFIKISTMPVPAALMNYAVSSADLGLALYDKDSEREARNGVTGGKIGTYLKNELPIMAGNAENLRVFDDKGVGLFWDGARPFDLIALEAINNMEKYRKNIKDFYEKNLQYEIFFEKFKNHLLKLIQ
jgi:hypothetical protein